MELVQRPRELLEEPEQQVLKQAPRVLQRPELQRELQAAEQGQLVPLGQAVP